ncbi:murein biosynthesis integral membrane protein MurJ [Heliobacterium chlorum]|uniref:Probable lipid II flippase MurJ n=1 Tax=Heliobacterium chlorum TaxID=2698 RepID=A0ABR7T1C9_HELCL|nr:murein biosynthesis integral membrane protein MurJ [Heliobacterium chlorum]MBC9784486.1 murein biosynthesis integral membrane protein MurJ [Heliobacterium chlorum]
MAKEKRIAQAAALIMVVTLAGRFFGFIREMLTARHFPAELVDTYLVAYTLPNIFGITMTGAFLAAFIPTFTQLIVNGQKERAWRVASTVLNAILLFFSALVILGIIFSPFVVDVLAPGFAGERLDVTVKLMRIMFPTLLFACLSGITSGILNSFDHFILPSIGPALASLTVVASILFLEPSLGIYALAVGTLAGLFLQLLIQIPAVPRLGFRYQWVLDLKDPLVRQIGVLIVPVLIGVGIGQANILIDRMLASQLPGGSITALNYANQIMQLPMGIFVQAISIPIFPALSALAAQNDQAGLERTMSKGFNYYSLLLTPITVGLMVLSVPAVRAILERGEFTPENTAATAIALFWYALGILPSAIRDLITRVFYALQDTSTPVKVGAVSVTLHIILNFVLVRFMSHAGLALATSLATMINMLILGWILWRRVGGWALKGQLILLGKSALAAVLMGFAVLEIDRLLFRYLGGTTEIDKVLQLTGAISAGFLIYLLVMWLLKVEEVQVLVVTFRQKIQGLLSRFVFRNTHS